MENGGLRRSITAMRRSFFNEGIVDGHFDELEQLHRDHYSFVERTFTEYFKDATTQLDTVEQEMNIVPSDFYKMDMLLNELRRDSGYLGARKVRNEVDKTRDLLQEGNLEGAKMAFQDLRNELDILKTNLGPYFQQKRLQAHLTQHRSPPR